MKRIENLTIDVKNSEYSELKLKQMDSTRLVFKLLDNSQPIPLVDCVADVIFTKPNGTVIIQDATINSQEVIVDLKEDCLTNYGKGKMEVELKKNSEVLSSFQMIMQIEKTSKATMTPQNTPNYVESMEKAIEELKSKSAEVLKEYEDLIATVQSVLANVTNRGHIYGIKRKITDLNRKCK